MINLKRKRKKPRIPTSAMSDIGFLLLIFIMLVSLMNYRTTVGIEYPEAYDLQVTQAEKNLELWVDQEGRLYVDGSPSSPAEVEQAVVEYFLEDPRGRVHVLADRGTAYGHVHQVVEILQLLQHRVVSFVVKEPGQ